MSVCTLAQNAGFYDECRAGNYGRSGFLELHAFAISTVISSARALWLIRVLNHGSYSCNFGRGQGYSITR